MYKYDSNIEKRDKFINDKNYYLSHVLSYVANFINTAVKLKVSLGHDEAGDQANKELKAFINKNCIDNFYDRFSDSLPGICARINDYAISNYKNYLSNGACNPNDASLVEFDKETKNYFLRDATVFIDNFINKSFDRAEYVSLSIKKPLIREMMSSDGKGSARHYINGVRVRAVKLKIFEKDLENKASNQ